MSFDMNSSFIQLQFQKSIQQYQLSCKKYLDRLKQRIIRLFSHLTDMIRIYVNRYPPLAAFLFTLIVLSSIPVSIFIGFGMISLICTLTATLVGFGVVEGVLLISGGSFLLFILGTIFLITLVGFLWGYAAYLLYCAGCKTLAVWKRGIIISSGKITKSIQPFNCNNEQFTIGTACSSFSGTLESNY